MFTVELPRLGGFPLDMLRFDSAWPSAPSDAAMIETLIRADDAEIAKLPRMVKVSLDTSRLLSPTVARWESFCVRVVA